MTGEMRPNRFSRLSKLLAFIWVGVGAVACSATAPTAGKHVPAGDILAAIRNQQAIYLDNKIIDGDLYFTTLATYPETETLRQATVAVPLFFRNCVFNGNVVGFRQQNDTTTVCTFQKNLSFPGCTFNGTLLLQSATVTGTSCFSRSTFNRRVTFAGTSFLADAYFDNLLVTQEAHFQQTRFLKQASFWKTVWAGTVYFQGTTFAGDAQFNLTEFRANLDFSLCKTTGLLTCNYARLLGRSSFDDCRFDNAVDFGDATLQAVSFNGARFATKASFTTIRGNTLSFDNALFMTQKPVVTQHPSGQHTVVQGAARLATFQPLDLTKP